MRAYGLYRSGDELYVVATTLAEAKFAPKAGLDARARSSRQAPGAELVGAFVRHPFLDRDSEVVSADYVELETGTGAVHTAPGHGADDFETGVRFGLPIVNPVDASGRFTAEAGAVCRHADLRCERRGSSTTRARAARCSRAEAYEHSYPHCWRCKNPVIFRATQQWFIAMDVNHLRQRAREKRRRRRAGRPAWGGDRMAQMIENHPEWCISRQRTWGTPIPALVVRACGDVVHRSRRRAHRRGVFRASTARTRGGRSRSRRSCPRNFACPKCGGREFDKGRDIVDIWFESGVTHLRRARQRRSALAGRPVSRRRRSVPRLVPQFADDRRCDQERRAVHARARDRLGRRRRRPRDAQVGRQLHRRARGDGQIRRRRVAACGSRRVEFTSRHPRRHDACSTSVGKVYRNLRNRLRMLLGVARRFRRCADACRATTWSRSTGSRSQRLDDARAQRHGGVSTSTACTTPISRCVAFDAEDLSSFYIDVLKDPMYSGARAGPRRRSAQTALLAHPADAARAACADALVHRRRSVAVCPTVCAAARPACSISRGRAPHRARRPGDEDRLALWNRAQSAARDGRRQRRRFATSQLQARVLAPPGDRAGAASTRRQAARGAGRFRAASARASTRALSAPRVVLTPATGEKCARCWKYLPLGADSGASGDMRAVCRNRPVAPAA